MISIKLKISNNMKNHMNGLILRKLSFMLIAVCLSLTAFSQSYEYTYSPSGDRIQRQLVLLKSMQNQNETDTAATAPVETQLGEMKIAVFPNPTNGTLRLEITNLPEREKQAVSLLYYEEMHQKEIAEILGVTEPRISQILAQAHNRLNSRILERLRIPVSPLKGGPNG